MDDLIKALTIFRKYGNPHYSTHCSHGRLTICGIDPEDVTVTDELELRELGFVVSESDEAFISFRFGSA